MYKLCSFAISINFLREFSSKTAPVGLLGLIRHIATVFGVIFDLMSSKYRVVLENFSNQFF
jgi:hypothetical protein